ncbi:MAG: hypothetical protein JST25_11265 [Actinobacteria bacterium]|nr:hypothetical protein [Actinomycetota bacterium]
MLQRLSDRAILSSPLPLALSRHTDALGTRARRADSARIRAGVYADGPAFRALPAWKRYAVRVHAFVAQHPDTALSLESAAVVHGLPWFGEPAAIHVHDPDRAHSGRFGDVRVHTSSAAREFVRVEGILATSLCDTVVDLVRLLPPAQALAVLDAALSPAQGGPLSLAAVKERASGRPGTRGTQRERWAWERADPRSESPSESVSRAVIEWWGFESPDLQHTFRYEGAVDRVDFLFPSRHVIGEADGWGKYELEDPERAAELLRAEKRRENRLRRHGHPFARWEPIDAWQATPLRDTLVAAGVPRVRPAELEMLATLQDRRRQLRSPTLRTP